MSDNKGDIIIEMRGITKKFGTFTANDKIDLSVRKGEVHAILGENGAGKTTLMNQLYGLIQPTEGEIFVHGKKVKITDPNVAISLNIGMVHQHFMLIQPFTVAESIVLGKETTKGLGFMDIQRAIREVEELSRQYGLTVDPHARIRDISVGMQQRVEILKALYRGADILIFDEPTAVLTPQEIDEFIGIVRNFTHHGRTVILITHKLAEIKAMADVCTIIRRGVRIDTVDVSSVSREYLASTMVGRSVSFNVEKELVKTGSAMLRIEGLRVKDRRGIAVLKGLDLEVRQGEVMGVAGVDGNGQTELVEALMGLVPVQSGNVVVGDIDVTGKCCAAIKERRVGSIPADRQKHGIMPGFGVAENLIIKQYTDATFSRRGILNFDNIRTYAKECVSRYDIRSPLEQTQIKNLSGGNQQKVIVAREISLDPCLLVAFQPTRGLDVGAIEFIHNSIMEQRNKGKAVLLISYELDEIFSLSDRIAVIYEGKIAAVLLTADTTVSQVGFLMAGGTLGAGVQDSGVRH